MSQKKTTVAEVKIDSLAYGGQGVGRLENGKVAFIRGALPNEKVLARIYRHKKSFVEGRTLEIIEPSSLRIEPRCPHFGICGGCAWQNMRYKDQLEAKELLIRELVWHHSELKNVPILPIAGMEDPWYYRNQSELSFSKHDSQIILGQHRIGSFSLIEDLTHCYILSPNSSEILNATREFCSSFRLSSYNRKTHQGFLRNLVVKIGKNTNELMLNLITSPGTLPETQFARFIRDRLSPTCILWTTTASIADRYTSETESVLWGNNYIMEKIADLKFQISAQSFFQTNTIMAEKLYQNIGEMAKGSEVIFDVYCGTGAISLFLAKSAQKVYGIESRPSAIEDAKINSTLNGITNAEFICAKAEYYLDTLTSNSNTDLVILDPPRAGVHPKVISSLHSIKPNKIIYISCNPTTLVRDLLGLTEKTYLTESIQPVDMFPHTYHIEVIAKLIRI